MRVRIERANLLKALNHVHRVVERRNTIPILANVLLKAEGDELSLKATDLDMEIVDRVPAAVEQAGASTVPAHMLYDIVRKLPDGAEIALDTRRADDGAESRARALLAADAAGRRFSRPERRRAAASPSRFRPRC